MIRKIPFILAVLSMVGGVLIGILFGVNEEMFHQHIHAGLDKNAAIQAITDATAKAAKIASETEKNWRYYQRFHFHATGIGAMMMGLLLYVSRLKAPARSKQVANYLISIGGFLYPFVWLFAALYGPEMGRAQAKEAFAIFGYMGGLFLLGGVWTTVLAVRYDHDL